MYSPAVRLSATIFLIAALFFLQPVCATPPAYINYEVWQGEAFDHVTSIAVSDDGNTVAAGSQDGTIYLIDGSGSLLWAYNNRRFNDFYIKPQNGGKSWTVVDVSADGKYVAAGIRDLSGLSAETPCLLIFDRSGNLLWSYTAKSVPDVDISDDGSIITAVVDSRVMSFARDGTRIWKVWRQNYGEISVSGDGSLVAWTDGYNKIALIDRTGEVVWEKDVENSLIDYNNPRKISMNGNAILVASNGLYDMDGDILWNYTAPSSVSPRRLTSWIGDLSHNGEYSVIGLPFGPVHAIDRQGRTIWTQDLNSHWSSTKVTISDDGSVIASFCDYNVTVMSDNGDIVWSARVPGFNFLALSSTGGSVVTTADDTIYYFVIKGRSSNPVIIPDLKSKTRYDAASDMGEYVSRNYVTADNIALGLIVLLILGVAGFCLWRIRRLIRERQIVMRVTGWTRTLLKGILIFSGSSFAHYFADQGSYAPYTPIEFLNYNWPMFSGILMFGSLIVIVISVGALVIGYARRCTKNKFSD